MSDVNVVMLINAMFAGCSEEEKAKLTALYQSAFSSTEYYKKLVQLLQTCDFYGTAGRDLYNRGSSAVSVGMTDATQFRACLDTMEYVILNAERAIAETEEYISTYRCDSKTLSVIEKNKAELLRRFYGYLVNVVCYTVACLYGDSYLQNFKIDPNANSLDIQQNVLNQLVSLMATLRDAKKPAAWKIVRRRFYGANLVKYDGFSIEYIDSGSMGNPDLKITPYLYGSSNASVLCSGAGNITNIMPANGMGILNSEVITKPQLNCLDSIETPLDFQKLDIIELINVLSNGKYICIPPEEIVEILNRYFMIQTVKSRQAKNVCIYCGGNNCNHFLLQRSFDDSVLPPEFRK